MAKSLKLPIFSKQWVNSFQRDLLGYSNVSDLRGYASNTVRKVMCLNSLIILNSLKENYPELAYQCFEPKNHGRDVRVKSTIGEGTMFTIRLPIRPHFIADNSLVA